LGVLFHSVEYFFLFAVTFAVFWRLRRQDWRLLCVLVASFVFYMTWNPWLVLLVVFSTSIDFLIALQLPQTASLRRRRGLLALGIGINLGILGFFKYANFLLSSAGSILDLLGVHFHARHLGLILPLGISFYTFEAISYLVDVYGGKIQPVRRPLDYLVYIMFFPHLIAGPIVRPHHFLPQLRQRRRFDWNRLELGARLFVMGLFKKAVIADNLVGIVDPVFAAPAAYGTNAVWLAVLGYAVQIYCDFSGYSDMAVGSAHALGFKLPENFNMPYFSGSISEFWSRWHVSLSRWLRDYLYIPLGGNRGGSGATYRNLMITMVLGGLWHGAAWTFVAWGFYHGLLLVIHRVWMKVRPAPMVMLRPLGVMLTFLSVCVGWVFFRASSFRDAGTILRRMAWPTAGADLGSLDRHIALTILAVVLAGHLIGSSMDVGKRLSKVPAMITGGGLAMGLLLCQLLMPEDVKAFIYFQF
jgi:alginate O-acetyltransferase complex protein AlgI